MPFVKKSNHPEADLGNIILPQMASFADDLAKQLAKSDGIKPSIAIKLGNPANDAGENDSLYVASNPQYIYYTTLGDESSGTNFMTKTIIPKEYRSYGQTVLVRKVNSGFQFVGLAAIADEIFNEGSETIQDQSAISQSQFDFATLQPILGSMQATVKGAIYGDTAIIDTLTADFSASPDDVLSNPIDIPTTANRAIGVLVQLNVATGLLSYKQSSQFNAAIALPEAYKQGLLPIRDFPLKRIGYVKLSNGIVALDYSSVWTCTEFFPDAPLLPNDMEAWGDAPSFELDFPSQSNQGDGTQYKVTGDELRRFTKHHVAGGNIAADSQAMLHVFFDSTTDRTFTLNAGSVFAGQWAYVEANQVSGGTGHQFILPVGCGFNGTAYRKAILNATTGRLLAVATSTTNFQIMFNIGMLYEDDFAATTTFNNLGGGSFTSFVAAADSGSSQTITDGNILTIAGGTGLSSVASATDTVTLSLDNTAVTPASYTNADITIDAQGRITAAASGTVALASEVSGTLPIGNGGTGQTTQTAAMDALSPTTTKGDLLVDNGTNVVRLPIGTNGYVPVADSSDAEGIVWKPASIHKAYNIDIGADRTTTSTSFGDVTGSNQDHTGTKANCIVRAYNLVNANSGANNTFFRLTLNGNADADAIIVDHIGTTGRPDTVIGRFTGLSAGTWTIYTQMKVGAGTGTLFRDSITYEIEEYD